MALDRNAFYGGGRWGAADTDNPQGEFLNETVLNADDRSYFDEVWANDWSGFFGRLLNFAGATPNGIVDNGTVSQVFDALLDTINQSKFLGWINATELGSGLAVSTTDGAVAAIGGSDIAYHDELNDEIRTYRFDYTTNTWAAFGTNLAVTGVSPTMSALTGDQVANVSSNVLRTFSFAGDVWAQVGNSLAVTGLQGPSIAALTSTRVAIADDGNDEIQAFDFDGADWAPVGNSFSLGVIGDVRITALSSTDIALLDSSNLELRLYRFDGTDWVQVGTGLSISPYVDPAMTTLNSTDIALVNDGVLSNFRFDLITGTWAQIGPDNTLAGADPYITSLNGKDLAFISNSGTLRTFRYEFFIGNPRNQQLANP